MSALLLGPLFGPVIFGFAITLSLKQSITDASEALEVPVLGSEHAPHLSAYLESRNLLVGDAPASREAALEAVRTGAENVVIVIPETFGEQLADGVPAKIEVITDQADRESDREARRASRALEAYGQELASMRLLARGVSPTVIRPLNVDQVDVSTPTGRSALLLGMLSYFFLFALLTCTMVALALALPAETVGTRFGALPSSLPDFAIPHIPLERTFELLPSAFTIAFLAGVESLLSAVVADGMTGGRHRSNIELVAQGVANSASALSMPAAS